MQAVCGRSATVLVCVVLGVAFVSGCGGEPSAEDLTAIALGDDELPVREEAASQLTLMGTDAQPMMIELLEKSDAPSIRAMAVGGLAANYSYAHIERLIELMADPEPQVRRAATTSVNRLLGRRYPPIPLDAPPEEQQKSLEMLRQEYQKMKESGMLDQWLERLKRKQQTKW